MTMEQQHRTEVKRSLDQKHFTAVCSCGYQGRTFDSHRDADNDADEHVLAITRGG